MSVALFIGSFCYFLFIAENPSTYVFIFNPKKRNPRLFLCKCGARFSACEVLSKGYMVLLY